MPAFNLSALSCRFRALWSSQTTPNSVPETITGGGGYNGYIPTLDGWRAVAILAVIFHHAMLPLLDAHHWLLFSEQGALGVDIFFALSGFLICSRLLNERDRFGSIDLQAFYLRRAFRILPPYLTYLAALFVLIPFGFGSRHLEEWISCLTFTRNYLPNQFWTWKTGHFWSLSVEEHFYLLFPAALVMLGAGRLRRFLPWFIAASTVWRMADYRFHLFDRIFPGIPYPYRTDIRVDGIAIGALAALLLAVPSFKAAIRDRLTATRIAAGATILLAIIFIPVPMGVLWQRLLIAAVITASALRPELAVTRWLEAKWLRHIGRLSFSLYIWQQMFFVPTQNSIGRALARIPALQSLIADPSDRAWILQLPLLCVGTVTMAALSYYLVEQPALRWGARYLKARAEAKSSAVVSIQPEFVEAARVA